MYDLEFILPLAMKFTNRELLIYLILYDNRGRFVSADELLRRLYGTFYTRNHIWTMISRMRKKGVKIKNKPEIGYKLVEDA